MTTAAKPDLTRAAQLFHALSDETRLGILEMLRSGERCVCELQDAFNAAQSRLSYHLKILKTAGLVADRQEGRWSYYTIQPTALLEAQQVVGELVEVVGVRTFAPQSNAKSVLAVSSSSGECCS